MGGESEVFRKCREPGNCGGPRITDKGEPFYGAQTIKTLIEQSLQEQGPVAHTIKPMPSFVDEYCGDAGRYSDSRLPLGQQESPMFSAVSDRKTNPNRDLPQFLRRRVLGEISKPLLREPQFLTMHFRRHQGKSGLEDPTVHQLGNRLAGRRAEGRPQILRIRVAIRMGAK